LFQIETGYLKITAGQGTGSVGNMYFHHKSANGYGSIDGKAMHSMTSGKAGGMVCESLKAVIKTFIRIESPVIEYRLFLHRLRNLPGFAINDFDE
jgi:hypothetical protein